MAARKKKVAVSWSAAPKKKSATPRARIEPEASNSEDTELRLDEKRYEHAKERFQVLEQRFRVVEREAIHGGKARNRPALRARVGRIRRRGRGEWRGSGFGTRRNSGIAEVSVRHGSLPQGSRVGAADRILARRELNAAWEARKAVRGH